MEDYKKRLLIEFKELNIKCDKLGKFIDTSPDFNQLDLSVGLLMKHQLYYMRGYLQTLYDRINLIITEKELEEFDNEVNQD